MTKFHIIAKEKGEKKKRRARRSFLSIFLLLRVTPEIWILSSALKSRNKKEFIYHSDHLFPSPLLAVSRISDRRHASDAKTEIHATIGVPSSTRPVGTIHSRLLPRWKETAHHAMSPPPAALSRTRHATPAAAVSLFMMRRPGGLSRPSSIEERETETDPVTERVKDDQR